MNLGLSAFVTFDAAGGTTGITLTGTTTSGSTLGFVSNFTPLVGTSQGEMTIAGGGLTWNPRVAKNQDSTGGFAVQHKIWDSVNVGALTNLAITATHSASGYYGNLVAFEMTGADTTAPYENSNSGGAASGTDPAMSTGDAANSTSDGFCVVAAGLDSSSATSILTALPTGFTGTLLHEDDQTAHMGMNCSYKLLSSAGNNSAGWSTQTSGASGCWGAVIATWKGTGGGGGGGFDIAMMTQRTNTLLRM